MTRFKRNTSRSKSRIQKNTKNKNIQKNPKREKFH